MVKNIFQKIYYRNLHKIYHKFSGIILKDSVNDIPDLIGYFAKLRKKIPSDSRILITYHNHLWEPILSIATKIGLRKEIGEQNWLEEKDVENILNICGFEILYTQSKLLGLITITVAKVNIYRPDPLKENSVSIIIPARNEEGNISKIIPSIPKFGKWQEIIFIEGNSTDNTWNKIVEITNKPTRSSLKLLRARQTGKGKADAVWLGFKKAKGDILMIYDADRTVDAKDLEKFYNVLTSGLGEFANGSRMVYPMEKQSMRFLNQIGNKIFGFIFTNILKQNFKDTLCGTKALLEKIIYL